MARTTASERVRLFVALDPPKRVRAAIAGWRDELLGPVEGLRPVAPEALHVTLAFLGWREAAEVDAIAAAALEAVEPGTAAPRLRPTGLAAVPRRRPRLFVLELSDEGGRCARLHARVSQALAAGGFYEPEERPFWAHITLARVRRGARIPPPAPLPPPSAPFGAAALTLYRSTLRPGGARYEPLARLPL